MNKILFALIVALTSTAASASFNTARVVTIRVNTTTNGSVRVSLELASVSTNCTGSWYSYEYSNSAPGSGPVWTSILLAAQARQREVAVQGNGNCDPHSIETVTYIDSLD